MHEHWIRLESVLAGPHTQEVTMDALLKNALRMRPDRIIVGEVRGPEAQTLFTALNTGHDGCMGTLHANTAMETITRITNPPMSVPHIQVAALDLIVMQTRIMTPQRTVRRVTEISEIGGFEAGKPSLNPLYVWTPRHGLKPTGVPSKLRERIAKAAGVPLTELDMVLKNRKEVLDYMVQHQIKDLPSVRSIIQEYNYI
jgi:flagellar protein FlaI